MFSVDQIKALSAPLAKQHVRTRTQSGRALSYVEGWHVISEANRIFGFDGWTSETVDIRCVTEKPREIGRDKTPGFAVSYVARVRITVGAITREGVGSGHGIDRDLGLAHESAIKEAETDARKRALMTFGNPFGLALYDKDQAHVADAPVAPSNVLTEALAAVAGHATKVSLRAWWSKERRGLHSMLDDAEYAQLDKRVRDHAGTLPEDEQSETEKDAA